jgi:prolyl 4-hydroxylase
VAAVSKRLLSDYIKVYEKTLSPEHCQSLIARFENSPGQHDLLQQDDGYSFVQLNVSKYWPEVESQIGSIMTRCIHQYRQSLGIGRFWPANLLSEGIRLKRYLPNGRDSFPPHVDVADQSSAARLVTAILYLNVPGGGETIFPDLGVSVTPEPGRLVVFPPLWTFVHAGMPPRDRAKYTLQSYLWYPPAPGASQPNAAA